MKHKRLGRGLEALITQSSPDEEDHLDETLCKVDVSKIHPNPYQPRRDLDRDELEKLKQSIRENGVIQPIAVRKVDGEFELIAGERRLRAVQELGFQEIPAFVMDVVSEDQMLEMALVENIQREDLNPIELAKAYHRLQKEYGLTQEAIAQKVGKDRASVANFIRLLKLPDIIQKSLEKEEISMGHARALMGLPQEGLQIRIWKKLVKRGWNVRKIEEIVRDQLEKDEKGKESKIREKSSYLVDIEDKLRVILGTQIHIQQMARGGKIEISYFSNEDLERIIELIQQIS
ncbi:ParB/RepB/Spo0J family partition protein [bacterium]|nr:ParB/RepB/Spo0J family partition protein [bacterium]